MNINNDKNNIIKKCIVVGAGECSPIELVDGLVLNDGDMCIAADGGLDYLIAAGITPDLVVGDMDSLSDRKSLEGLEIRLFPTEKDDTDMLCAIKEGLARGYKTFELYGGLGGSFDHTFGNIQCLMYLINNGAQGVLKGINGCTLRLIKNGSILFKAGEYENGRRISVFSYGNEACGVTETGLKYSISDVDLKNDFPIGVSNEFTYEDAYISVKNGILMIYVGQLGG